MKTNRRFAQKTRLLVTLAVLLVGGLRMFNKFERAAVERI